MLWVNQADSLTAGTANYTFEPGSGFAYRRDNMDPVAEAWPIGIGGIRFVAHQNNAFPGRHSNSELDVRPREREQVAQPLPVRRRGGGLQP